MLFPCRQPEQFIKSLEKAGLGYKVEASATKDRMGEFRESGTGVQSGG